MANFRCLKTFWLPCTLLTFFRILTGCACCKKCVGDQEPMDSLELGFQVKNGIYNVGFQNNEDKLWNYQSKSSKLRTSPIKMHRFLSLLQKFKQWFNFCHFYRGCIFFDKKYEVQKLREGHTIWKNLPL